MPDDLRRLPPAEPRGQPITIELDGEPVRAFEGEPVAVALFAGGVRLLSRSTKYHRPRGLFCATGHCASCLMRIDGRPNLRACVEPARPGLRCERQNAFPDPDVDLLRAADWLFPQGMDHHRLMTGSRLGNQLFVKLVRQMGGTGTLPDEPPASDVEAQAHVDVPVDVCIVGAGPAGLTAAATLAKLRPGTKLLVIDDQDRPGGSLLAEPGGLAQGARLAGAAEREGVTLWPSSTAIAFYPEERRLAVKRPTQLCQVSARRYLYATGSYDQNLPVEDNDRPGILAARAVGRLAFRFGVRPGARVFIACPPDPVPAFTYLARLASRAAGAGRPGQPAPVGHPAPGRSRPGRDRGGCDARSGLRAASPARGPGALRSGPWGILGGVRGEWALRPRHLRGGRRRRLRRSRGGGAGGGQGGSGDCRLFVSRPARAR